MSVRRAEAHQADREIGLEIEDHARIPLGLPVAAGEMARPGHAGCDNRRHRVQVATALASATDSSNWRSAGRRMAFQNRVFASLGFKAIARSKARRDAARSQLQLGVAERGVGFGLLRVQLECPRCRCLRRPHRFIRGPLDDPRQAEQDVGAGEAGVRRGIGRIKPNGGVEEPELAAVPPASLRPLVAAAQVGVVRLRVDRRRAGRGRSGRHHRDPQLAGDGTGQLALQPEDVAVLAL